MPQPISAAKMHTNYLLGGEPGVGKTTLAVSAVEHPDFCPLLVADLEDGLRSVAQRENIYVDRIHSVQDLEALAWRLQTGAQDYSDFKSLVIDSGSELQSLDLEHTAAAAVKKSPDRDDVDQLEVGDYAKNTTRMRRVFRLLRNLPVHIITTAFLAKQYPPTKDNSSVKEKLAQAKLIKDGFIKPIKITPQFTDKLGQSLMGFVDCCWMMFSRTTDGEVERFLITKPKGPVFAKTRIPPAFADRIETEYIIRLDENGDPRPSLAELHDRLEQARS